MQRCPCNVKRVGITWGISDDVCLCILYFLQIREPRLRKLVPLELTTGMSMTATDYTYALYIGQTFLLVRNV
jgi:uncharacterized membrane protein (UPF0136 family)